VDMPASIRLNVDMKSRGQVELTIGGVAAHFGLATHVLRHWEAMGLLAPARTGAGRRRYQPADLYRVAAILRAKQAGLALDDIRAMLTSDPATRRGILRRQRDELAGRIAQAQTSLALLEQALACKHGDLATCPQFQALLADQVHQPATAHPGPGPRTAVAPERQARRRRPETRTTPPAG
jgi:MerR family transcriptional regulator, copper efflux regulator